MNSNNSGSILVWQSGSHCLGGRTRDDFFALLREKLAGRVREAWIFGSVATDEYGPSSDVDLILVTDTALPFPSRPSVFSDLWDLTDRLDLLVYTPDEFRDLTTDPSIGFWATVTQQMVRLI